MSADLRAVAVVRIAGDTVDELVAGQPYFRPAGVEHDVYNANAYEFAFIEIELKE